MTEAELQAIRQRCEAATLGPWRWTRDDGDLVGSGVPACTCGEDPHKDMPIVQTDRGYYGPCVADRAFIAHARTDVPALLDEVARWRSVRARLAAIVAGDEAAEYVLECYDKALAGKVIVRDGGGAEYDAINALVAEVERLRGDAARYRWLRTTLESAVCGYVSNVEADDLSGDEGTLWTPPVQVTVRVNDEAGCYGKVVAEQAVKIQWYPNTPVGFNSVMGRTLDDAVDAGMKGDRKALEGA